MPRENIGQSIVRFVRGVDWILASQFAVSTAMIYAASIAFVSSFFTRIVHNVYIVLEGITSQLFLASIIHGHTGDGSCDGETADDQSCLVHRESMAPNSYDATERHGPCGANDESVSLKAETCATGSTGASDTSSLLSKLDALSLQWSKQKETARDRSLRFNLTDGAALLLDDSSIALSLGTLPPDDAPRQCELVMDFPERLMHLESEDSRSVRSFSSRSSVFDRLYEDAKRRASTRHGRTQPCMDSAGSSSSTVTSQKTLSTSISASSAVFESLYRNERQYLMHLRANQKNAMSPAKSVPKHRLLSQPLISNPTKPFRMRHRIDLSVSSPTSVSASLSSPRVSDTKFERKRPHSLRMQSGDENRRNSPNKDTPTFKAEQCTRSKNECISAIPGRSGQTSSPSLYATAHPASPASPRQPRIYRSARPALLDSFQITAVVTTKRDHREAGLEQLHGSNDPAHVIRLCSEVAKTKDLLFPTLCDSVGLTSIEASPQNEVSISASTTSTTRNALEHEHEHISMEQKAAHANDCTNKLEEELKAATVIQTCCRASRAHSTYLDARISTIIIQSWWRGIEAKMVFLYMKNASLIIQRNWRLRGEKRGRGLDRKGRKRLLSLKVSCEDESGAAYILQAWWRAMAARRIFLRYRTAVIIIQYTWRIRHSALILNRALMTLQAWWRSMVQVRIFLCRRRAALIIQYAWRISQARWNLRKNWAAITISKALHQLVARWRVSVMLNYRKDAAARLIQRAYRKYRAEKLNTVTPASGVAMQREPVVVRAVRRREGSRLYVSLGRLTVKEDENTNTMNVPSRLERKHVLIEKVDRVNSRRLLIRLSDEHS